MKIISKTNPRPEEKSKCVPPSGPEPPAPPQPPTPAEQEKHAQKKVLIVDDNAAVCTMLEKLFRLENFLTAVANDGLQCLQLARVEKPDLIVLDVMLPGMDGYKVCRMIKFDHQLKDIPVLILTSRMGDEDEKLAYQCGADAFVVKATKTDNILVEARKLMEK